MASYGVIGAIGGAAQGFNSALQAQLEEARQMRLEQVRTRNNQETNRLNNEQRHEFSLVQQKARDESQNTLLQTSDKMARDRVEWERGLPPTTTFEDSDFGGVPGQRNAQTNEFKPVGGSANYRPSSKLQEAEYLRSAGIPDEEINRYIMGGGSNKPQVIYREEPIEGQWGAVQKVPYQVVADAEGNVSLQPLQVGGAPPPPVPRTFDEAFDQAMKKWGDKRSEDEIRQAVLNKFPQFAPK